MSNAYINSLDSILARHSNPENAFFMKKYMKNKFEFFGIKTGPRRELTKQLLKKDALPPMDQLDELIRKLWRKPQREYHYFAIELVEKHIKRLDNNSMPLIEYMITHKSWWDTVDGIAVKIVGDLFQIFPELIIPSTEKWMATGNIWLQRTSILFQLKYKTSTDTRLLFKYITELHGSKEFFINKAIGWALREYSKTDARLVKDFTDTHTLSPLSRREALKIINKEAQ